MRRTIKNAISESVQDLVNPAIHIDPDKIRHIRRRTHVSQSVFAKLLNVSPSSIRQWEQGKRKPTGSTKVLLEVLEKEPHVLDYRMESNGTKKEKAA
jgi:putative transcriptional regulator